MTSTFNLTDRPWLPVETTDGRHLMASLSSLFADAARIRRLDAGPMPARMALHRLLFAVAGAARRDGLDPVAYLAAHHGEFDLYDPIRPFMQTPGLEAESGREPDNLSALLGPFAPNNQRAWTSPFGRSAGPSGTIGTAGGLTLAPDEAARWLVASQACCGKGIKTGCKGDPKVKPGSGKRYGSPAGPLAQWATLLVEGPTLADTLALNTPDAPDGDRPVWELDPQTPGERARPDGTPGPLELLTWQPQRVRIIHDDAGRATAALVTAGDPIPGGAAGAALDPMMVRYVSKDGARPLTRPKTDPEPWRILASDSYVRPAAWSRADPDTPITASFMLMRFDDKGTVLDDIVSGRLSGTRARLADPGIDPDGARRAVRRMGRLKAALMADAGFDSDPMREHMAARGEAEASRLIADTLASDPIGDACDAVTGALTALADRWMRALPRRGRYAGAGARLDGLGKRLTADLKGEEPNGKQ